MHITEESVCQWREKMEDKASSSKSKTARSKPYPKVKPQQKDSNSQLAEKENSHLDRGEWLSTRKAVAALKNPPDFILNSKDDTPSITREEMVERGLPLIEATNNRGKRYCCPDCAKWYQGSPLYASDEIHLSRTGRHRQPRPVTPPGFWKIGFEDDSD